MLADDDIGLPKSSIEKEKLKNWKTRIARWKKYVQKESRHTEEKTHTPSSSLLLRYNIQSKQKMVSHLSPLLVAMRSHRSRNTECDALRAAFTFWEYRVRAYERARAECAEKSKPALVFFANCGECVARRTDKFGRCVATALLPARLHQEIRWWYE